MKFAEQVRKKSYWLKQEQDALASLKLQVEDSRAWLALADSLREMGRWQESIDAYRSASDFGEREAWLGQASVMLATGDSQAAANLAQIWIDGQEGKIGSGTRTENQTRALAYRLLGLARLRSGKIDEASLALQQAIKLSPKDPDVLSAWALYLAYKNAPDALSAFDEALNLRPDNAETLTNRAAYLIKSGEFDKASRDVDKALAIKPWLLAAWKLKARIAKQQGNGERTFSAWLEVLAIDPTFAAAAVELGLVAGTLEQIKRAITIFEDLAANYPKHRIMALNNMGLLYLRLKQNDKARTVFETVISESPSHPVAYVNFANLLYRQKRVEEAAEICQKALDYQPKLADAWGMLGTIRLDQWYLDDALTCYDKALEYNPDMWSALSNRLLTLHYKDNIDAQSMFDEHRRYAERLENSVNRLPAPSLPIEKKRLKIGYVSADFRSHSVAYFFEPLLAAHNHDDFEIICYSGVESPDLTTDRLQAMADGWVNTFGVDDNALALRIAKDGIDILVDLAGHTSGVRLPMFARKPAPIQITWLGYPDTTGLSGVDFRFTDHWADPPSTTDKFHSERLWRLKGGFSAWSPPDESPPISLPQSISLAAKYLSSTQTIKSHGIRFGCFNNIDKISHVLLRLWVNVLNTLPDSTLVLKARQLNDQQVRQRVKEAFITAGGDAKQLELLAPCPDTGSHLATYGSIDIALDTFPYHGVTTTCEALWMGVPVIVLEGDRHSSRVGVSLLNQVGLTQFIAKDQRDYVEKAVDLAMDLEQRIQLRQNLRQAVANSLLCDGKRLAIQIEAAYRAMACGAIQPEPEIESELITKSAQIYEIKTVGQKMANKKNVNSSQLVHEAVAAYQRKEYAEAERLGKKALQRKSGTPEFLWHFLGAVQRDAGRVEDAVQSCSKAVELNPLNADACANLGLCLSDQGRISEGMEWQQKALKINPDHFGAWMNLGSLLLKEKRITEAEQAFIEAGKRQVSNSAVQRGIAACRREAGNKLESIEIYRQWLAKEPDDVAVLTELGGVLLELSRWIEAKEVLEKARDLAPTSVTILTNLGNIYKKMYKTLDAKEVWEMAANLYPDEPVLCLNLGVLYKDIGRPADAQKALMRAIELKPDYDNAYNNIGNLRREEGDNNEARRAYLKCIEINPHHWTAWSNILFVSQNIGDITGEMLFEDHLRFGTAIKDYGITPQTKHTNTPNPDRVLRIGYISPDFLSHSVSYFIEPVLEHHNRQQVHVTCFANQSAIDSVTERLQKLADCWHFVENLTDDELITLIIKEQIDILVDLSGHTGNNRLLVFARRPAPIQVTWIGYPDTTGLDTIDYRFTDHWADPVGLTDKWHTEKLFRLTDGFSCYRPVMNAPDVSEPPCITRGHITFGSFNSLAKVDPEVVAVWSHILEAVPGSRLMIKSLSLDDDGCKKRYIDYFENNRISRDRLIFRGKIPSQKEHLAAYGEMDIALDTFPYHGATTTCEALWMGLPVITLAGERHVSRVGLSLLNQIGAVELIAKDRAQYIEIAVALANDPERLRGFRQKMRETMASSPLCNAAVKTAAVEDAYRKMWSDYCASSKVEPGEITAKVNGTYEAGRTLEVDAEIQISQTSVLDVINMAAQEFERGVSLLRSGDLSGAEPAFRSALAADSDLIPGWINLGTTLNRQGRFKEAESVYREAIKRSPESASAHAHLGGLLCNLGRLAEAEQICRMAVMLDPVSQVAHGNLGLSLLALSQFTEAEVALQRTIEIGPDTAEVNNNLSVCFQEQGKLEDALQASERAIELSPDFAEAHANRAVILTAQGRLSEATEANRQVIRLKPELYHAISNYLLTLNYNDGLAPKDIFEEHRQLGKRFSEVKRKEVHTNDAISDRRLRVGYVSADFCGHSVAFFILPLLQNHNRTKIEITCYSQSSMEDYFTDRIKESSDHWQRIIGLNDRDVADMIIADGVDILVDLGGHTSKNRLGVFALKPAPIQVTWLGYPNTTGIETIDYRLTDDIVDPEGEADTLHTERLVRLPKGFLCYKSGPNLPDVGGLPFTRNGFITFGSFNNLAKVTPATISLWCRVLNQLPDSRLVVKYKSLADSSTRDRYRDLVANQCIDPARVDWLAWEPTLKTHLEIYNLVDIALDTIPYNGTTTTCEALSMGVPVITLAGDRHAGRVGASLLTRVGLTELIADNPDEYIAIAAELARDTAHLASLRGGLRKRLLESPLCDGLGFAKSVETAYRSIWREWCLNIAAYNKLITYDQLKVGKGSTMKVLIIVCRQSTMRSYQIPIGIGYVSACLKRAGHDVVVINPNHSLDELQPLLETAIVTHKPQVVATGGMAFHLSQIRTIASIVRKLLPDVNIVIGGPLVTNQPQVAMKAIPEADFGVIGEGEHTTVELLDALGAGTDLNTVKGLIYRTPEMLDFLKQTEARPIEENLDNLPWVDYEGLGLDVYAGLHRPGEAAPALILDENTRVMPIMTSRGCPYSCTFYCHEAAGRRYRLRSLDDVFAEIKSAIERYGINALFIYDDLFCFKRSRLKEFCRRVAPLGLRWECSMTAGQIDPEILKLMKDSGCCCISVGVESMSPAILKSMQKRATREDLERVLSQIYEARIGIWSNLIFGDPAETLDTVTESLEWFSNHPEYNLRFAIIGYHPGSRIYEDAVARGLIGDPIAYLMSGQWEINGTNMSNQDFLAARILINRALISFGFAGKLLELQLDSKKGNVARCSCPYCGEEGRNYTIGGDIRMLEKINCPICNRAFRVPVVVRLKPSSEVTKHIIAVQQMEKSGGRIADIVAACNHILTIDTGNEYAWQMLIRIAEHSGYRLTAARLLEQAISYDPYNPSLFEQMANYLSELGFHRHMAKYVKKAKHLRSIGVAKTTYLDIIMSPVEHKATLDGQINYMNASLRIASFLIGQDKEMINDYGTETLNSDPRSILLALGNVRIPTNSNQSQPENIRSVNIRGDVKVMVPNDLSLMTPYVLMEQEDWFEDEIHFVRRLAETGMAAIDIGCSYGVYALTLAKLVGEKGRVWTFEPTSQTAYFVSQSLVENNFSNVDLIRAALSDHEGEATLSLNANTELNTLHVQSHETGSETVRLTTLDECSNRWNGYNITFVKLDVVGEEVNVLRGGLRFFTDQSPLVMFGIKHGQSLNLDLADHFVSLGYDVYRLVTGLGVLEPFQHSNPLDSFQLNLFAAKPDQAKSLAARGLLAMNVRALPSSSPVLWWDRLGSQPWATVLLTNWYGMIHSNSSSEWVLHRSALNAFAQSEMNTFTAEERVASLKLAFEQISKSVKYAPTFPRLFSFIRIATAIGQRAAAVQALTRLQSMLQTGGTFDLDEPFLPVDARFESIAPDDRLADWVIVSIFETLERLGAYSAFFAPERSRDLLTRVVGRKFCSPESERRFKMLEKQKGGYTDV